MTKLAILSLFGGFGYFIIQYFGGWMVYIPTAQQVSVAVYAVLLCWVTNKLLGEQIYLLPLLIAPLVSLVCLLVIYKGELGILYGTSVLNLIAFILAVLLSKKMFNI
ncbi:hypothetical protein V8687_11745 [Shewanella baltica]|uniref:hypothetical protein n=1 Tax=Shewanella baltica TaxID=62322 RepID=UPI0030CA6EED